MAAKIISQMRTVLSVDLPFRAFFENPTVADLAAQVQLRAREKGKKECSPLRPIRRDTNLPLSYTQERFWFLDQFHAEREVYNALRAFRLTGPFNEEALCKSVQEILNRHEILRTTFVTVDGKPQQIISAPFTIEVPIIDLQEVTEEEREVEVQRLMKEENRPFDLARGPLIRVKLLRFHEQEHQ